MDEKHNVCTVDGFDISLAVTEGSGRDIVVWMHGITVDKDEHLGFFREGAHYLAQEGFTSVRFDFRGHGKSSGTSLDFCIVGQNLDVKAVLDFVAEHIASGEKRIHLVGASFGAPPAIFAGARYASVVKSLCLISPVLSYRRTFLEPETEWAAEIFTEEKLKGLEKGGKLQFDDGFWIERHLVEEMRIVRPDVALRELSQPVLVFHGNKDSMVPYQVTVEACRGLRHVKLITMHGVDHGFMLEGDEEGTTPGSVQNKVSIYRRIASHFKDRDSE